MPSIKDTFTKGLKVSFQSSDYDLRPYQQNGTVLGVAWTPDGERVVVEYTHDYDPDHEVQIRLFYPEDLRIGG